MTDRPMVLRRSVSTAATIAGLFLACSGSKDAPLPLSASCNGMPIADMQARSADSIGENVDSTCASVAHDLQWKMQPTGSTCTDPIDCTPVCCICANGTHHALTTWCNEGKCAAPETVCCMVLGTTLGTACGS